MITFDSAYDEVDTEDLLLVRIKTQGAGGVTKTTGIGRTRVQESIVEHDVKLHHNSHLQENSEKFHAAVSLERPALKQIRENSELSDSSEFSATENTKSIASTSEVSSAKKVRTKLEFHFAFPIPEYIDRRALMREIYNTWHAPDMSFAACCALEEKAYAEADRRLEEGLAQIKPKVKKDQKAKSGSRSRSRYLIILIYN